jgi:hypothetical protein
MPLLSHVGCSLFSFAALPCLKFDDLHGSEFLFMTKKGVRALCLLADG